MKHILKATISSFLLLLFIAGSANAQEIQIGLNIIPNPPNHLSDWQSDPNAVTISVTNLTTQNLAARIGATIDKDGSRIADIKDNAKPNVTLHPGINFFRGADILPAYGMEYFGSTGSDAQRTGILPEGTYRLCVNINAMIPSNSPSAPPHTANAEDCKSFTIAIATPPILITPADGSTVNGPIINFSWLPPMPQSSQPMKYDLKIVEILGNQSPEDALRSNPPIVQKQTSGTSDQIPTEMIELNLTGGNPFTTSQNGNHNFAWGVTSNSNGNTQQSQPSTFRLGLPVGRPVSDTDCNKFVVEYQKMTTQIDSTCKSCDSLDNALNALQQQLALAQQSLTAANADLNKAKSDADKANKGLTDSKSKYAKALAKLKADAAAAGLEVIIYNGSSSSIQKEGYSTIAGGTQGLGGIAVQGSQKAIMDAGKNIPGFWADFKKANNELADAKEQLAIMKEREQKAQDEVEYWNQQIADLNGVIANLRAQLADCRKNAKQFTAERDTITILHDSCLHLIDLQTKAGEKIKAAEDALSGANAATGSSSQTWASAGSDIGDHPTATSSAQKLDQANAENDKSKTDEGIAQQTIDKAKAALATGHSQEAAQLADSAKLIAERARLEAEQAQKTAVTAQHEADAQPTKAQIEESKKKAEERRKQDELAVQKKKNGPSPEEREAMKQLSQQIVEGLIDNAPEGSKLAKLGAMVKGLFLAIEAKEYVGNFVQNYKNVLRLLSTVLKKADDGNPGNPDAMLFMDAIGKLFPPGTPFADLLNKLGIESAASLQNAIEHGMSSGERMDLAKAIDIYISKMP